MLHMYVSCFIYLCYLLWYIPVNRLIKILLINISAWEVEHLQVKLFHQSTKKKNKKKKSSLPGTFTILYIKNWRTSYVFDRLNFKTLIHI